ncbi:hypothetical protein RF11_15612 [Thelohanellus kitauei]|uniref:Uncharacterized protein n=1 Tax=Thelohanellus kitauei TaxID=669202 RepID=A0A0C2NC49_THEKT|nr:hypothetical protein RF11_15612 [Thelohanellus kitauei]
MVVCGARGVCGHECSTHLKYEMDEDTVPSQQKQAKKAIRRHMDEADAIDKTLDEDGSMESKINLRNKGIKSTKIINPRIYIPIPSADLNPETGGRRPSPPSPPAIRYIGNLKDCPRAAYPELCMESQQGKAPGTSGIIFRSQGLSM